jgi:hypothetical protein
MFLLRTGKEIVALAVKIGNANMKPPPFLVEVISLPKTCPDMVLLRTGKWIVALTGNISNANTNP